MSQLEPENVLGPLEQVPPFTGKYTFWCLNFWETVHKDCAISRITGIHRHFERQTKNDTDMGALLKSYLMHLKHADS